MIDNHGIDIFMERLPVSSIKLLRIVVRWLLNAHFIDSTEEQAGEGTR